MKKDIYRLAMLFLIVCFFGNTTLFAQSNNQSDEEKTVMITIVTNDDEVIVKKKRINPGELPVDFDEFRDLDADDIKTIDVEIVERSATKKACKPSKKCMPKKDCNPNGNTIDDNLFFFKNGNTIVEVEEMEELRQQMRSHRRDWNVHFGDEPKPLLGVYVSDEKTEEGVLLSNVMRARGAAKAGLRAGDIITKINGDKIKDAADIAAVIKGMKPGDEVRVDFIQDGQNKKTSVELSAGKPRFRHFNFHSNVKRDPCKVFIGVYTTRSGEGVKINGIIDDTPAAAMQLEEGDIILELDNVKVHSQSELVRERDLNQPGDYFKLTILRDGNKKSVRGQFKSCEEEQIDAPDIAKPEILESPSVNLDVFQAYPNPTFGDINIEFEGEAVPTVVRITDITGKVVFEDRVSNFDGYYNRAVHVNNARPGNLSVSVIQNNKATTKNIILLNRA